MSEENEKTSIALFPKTKDRLTEICRKDQSYDDLINQMIDERKK